MMHICCLENSDVLRKDQVIYFGQDGSLIYFGQDGRSLDTKIGQEKSIALRKRWNNSGSELCKLVTNILLYWTSTQKMWKIQAQHRVEVSLRFHFNLI